MIIAIVTRYENLTNETPINERYYISGQYKEMFDDLGIIISPVVSDTNIEEIAKICDGVILSGNYFDINPKHYQEDILERVNLAEKYDSYLLDARLIAEFSKLDKPILGICGGMQSINVYYGGSLFQDMPGHNLNNKTHTIDIVKDSFLADVYGSSCISVNSYHHQSVNMVAPSFKVTSLSPDGVIESIERHNIIGVQWHPEIMQDKPFFEEFISLVEAQKSISN